MKTPCVAIVGLLLALAVWPPAPTKQGAPQEVATLRTAPREVSVLVKQAIEDLLERRALPDGNLLADSRRIPVREEMPRAAMRLGREALPVRAGYEFHLITRNDAQAQADATNQGVHFIVVDRPEVDASSAKLSVGLGIVVPTEPKRMVLCCCTGNGEFSLVDGRWRFAKWASMVCS